MKPTLSTIVEQMCETEGKKESSRVKITDYFSADGMTQLVLLGALAHPLAWTLSSLTLPTT